MSVPDYHAEVAATLERLGDARLGEAIRRDRGSQLHYFGVRVPALRAAVKRGFSFYSLPTDQVLAIWDAIWNESPHGEVLFAAIEYYMASSRRALAGPLWPVVREWSGRVDNWAHSDALSGLYSHIVERLPGEVFPQLEAWNRSGSEWLARISIVSLIHYSGKNAVFLEPDQVFPLVTNCLDDNRHYVQTAVGWVLREMGHAYPGEVRGYIEGHGAELSSAAFSSAIARRSSEERVELRVAWKAARDGPSFDSAPPNSLNPA